MFEATSLMVALSLWAGVNLAQASERVEVFTSPYCGCCEKWVERRRQAGFNMVKKDASDVTAARKAAGMPQGPPGMETLRQTLT